MTKVNLKKLSLNTDSIGSLTVAGLLNLKTLEYVSFRDNTIVIDKGGFYLVPAVHNLTYFDCSCQYHYGCSDVYPWADFLPGVPTLYQEHPFSNTTVKPLNRSTISLCFLPKLHTLKLSYVLFEINLVSFCWADSHIVNIDMSYSKQIWTAGIKQGTFSGSAASQILKKNINLKFLDLSDLGLASLHKTFLYYQNKLEILILSHNKFTTMTSLILHLYSSLICPVIQCLTYQFQ